MKCGKYNGADILRTSESTNKIAHAPMSNGIQSSHVIAHFCHRVDE